MKRKRLNPDDLCNKLSTLQITKDPENLKDPENYIELDEYIEPDNKPKTKIIQMVDKSTQTDELIHAIIQKEIKKYKSQLQYSYVSLLNDNSQVKTFSNIII